jgi:hypothetical protein
MPPLPSCKLNLSTCSSDFHLNNDSKFADLTGLLFSFRETLKDLVKGVISSSVCRGAASPAQNVVCASGSIFQAPNPPVEVGYKTA